MSGGVDSSVAAYLMKEQGYTCMGIMMKLFGNADLCVSRAKSCCSLDDAEDARSVAFRLGMPFHVLNFADRFSETVIDRFIRSYECGRTPNPCIDCNRFLKFDALYRRARELGYDYVVTGHYARIEQDAESGRYLLKKALDPNKDQSYVLYALTQEELSHTMFPLGALTKPQVRAIADAQGFVTAQKQESQDICFVPDGDYAGFIRKKTGKDYPAGDFVDCSGRVLGRHRGIIHYTVGQRRGLGLALPEPMYVCRIDPENNRVVLSPDAGLYSREVHATDINLISVPKIEGSMRVRAKLRYRHAEQWATVTQPDENSLTAVFDEPQRAITKGQALVLYDGDTVVGGGTIC